MESLIVGAAIVVALYIALRLALRYYFPPRVAVVPPAWRQRMGESAVFL